MTEFRPDRTAYLRTHAVMAAVAMAAGMALLWAAGSPPVGTGAVGGLAAVAIRGWYLLDEEIGHVWRLTDTALEGPAGRHVPLNQLAQVRTIGSAVQLVTTTGTST